MTPDQREEAEKLAAVISTKTMSAESKLEQAIDKLGNAVKLADEIADKSNSNEDKRYSLRIRAHQERLKSSLAAIKASHCEASILQADALAMPMTRGGER